MFKDVPDFTKYLYLEFLPVVVLRFFRDIVQISFGVLPGVSTGNCPKIPFFNSLIVASLVLAEVFQEFIYY